MSPPAPRSEIATAIVNLDPTHEEACCHLMRMHAEQGDVAGALRIYKALWDLLDRDYGMEPSPATEELVADIKLGAFERPAGPDSASGSESGGAHDGDEPTAMPDRSVAAETRPGRSRQDAPGAAAVSGCMASTATMLISCRDFGLHLAACLVRFREWTRDRPAGRAVALPLSDSAPQYCIETHRLSGR